jgi:hypothetical protein
MLGDILKVDFWHEPWLDSLCLATIAPDLFKYCTKGKITVGLALHDNKWMRHFKRHLSHTAIN